MAMTPESVEKALDEVRPYLIADGGNVEVWRPLCSLVSVKCISHVGNALLEFFGGPCLTSYFLR